MSIPPRLLRRLLLADDDREVRMGVADLLDDLGLEIVHAESGIEAIQLVRRAPVHVALLDMHMPGCTGIEAIPQLQRAAAGLPCIVYSGRWSVDHQQEVLSAGAFAYLKKPVEPLTLRRTVLSALGLPFDTRPQNN